MQNKVKLFWRQMGFLSEVQQNYLKYITYSIVSWGLFQTFYIMSR